jgi:hypothetical protein
MYTAAAPNSAPIPTAPVFIGPGAPAVLDDEAPGAAALVAASLMLVVAEGWPDVKGASETAVAPGKPGSPSSSAASAMVVLPGFKTLLCRG